MYAMCASEISSCRLLRDEGVVAVVVTTAVVVSDGGEDKARRRKMRVTEVNIVRMVGISVVVRWFTVGWR